MSNFDAKFGPRPVNLFTDANVLALQFVVVFVAAYSLEPAFLNAPRAASTSITLTLLFSLLSVAATVAAQRSFIPLA